MSWHEWRQVNEAGVGNNEARLSDLLGRRCAAFLVDYILLLLVPTATLVLGVWIRRHWPLVRAPQLIALPGFIGVATAVLYRAVFAKMTVAGVVVPLSILGYIAGMAIVFHNWIHIYTRGGQSLGKYLFGLRVRARDGGSIGFGMAVRRHIIGYPLMILGLGLLRIVRDPRQPGWHDLIAGTIIEGDEESGGANGSATTVVEAQ